MCYIVNLTFKVDKMELYKDKIKVICEGLMCFPVNPNTLEATSTSYYDPYAICDPDPTPLETISHSEWCNRKQGQEHDTRYKEVRHGY